MIRIKSQLKDLIGALKIMALVQTVRPESFFLALDSEG
jgi:hypothetical protein